MKADELSFAVCSNAPDHVKKAGAMSVSTQHFWRSSALPFVELRSTQCSLQAYKPHFHAQLSLGAVIAGRTRARCAGQEYELSEGDLILIAPYAVHACNPIARQPRSYHMLYVDATWCRERVTPLRERSLEFGCSVIRNPRLFAHYLELVASLADLRAPLAAAKLESLLTEAAEISVATRQVRCASMAEQIRQAVLDSLATPKSLDALASDFKCRKETLIRVFKRAYQITPHAFLSNLRVEQAKRRLMVGEKIADVAADLGFSDQAQLHRTFVSYTASTPGQYRKGQSKLAVNFRQ